MEVKFTQPCNDCPFRRDATPGWLGGSPPEWFVESALADYAAYGEDCPSAPCHKTVDYNDPTWQENLGDAAPCAGALIFCKNNMKSPRDAQRSEMVAAVEVDREKIFTTAQEFIDFHRSSSVRSWEDQ